jgi:hypothetical protein
VPDLPLTGRCLCGAVRFEIDAPLGPASYCHCTRCQRRTGTAASANARVEPGSLKVTHGRDLVHEWQPPDGSAKCFCSACGGALWSHNHETGAMGVRLGVLDRDPGVRPEWRQFVAYAAPWEPVPDDGLPRFDEARPMNS